MLNEELIDKSVQFENYTEEDLYRDLSDENSRNVIINHFKNQTEVIIYKKAFYVNHNKPNPNIDRRRKFYYDENDELQAKDGFTYNDLIEHIPRSRRRALDNFIGYAMCNTWRYFITLTFDPRKIDRSKRSEVCKAWELVRKKLQYRFPEVRTILITEEHNTDKCLHFHGLIGGCDLSMYLSPAINNMKYISTYDFTTRQKIYAKDLNGNLIPNKYYGQLLKTKYGDQIYNFTKDLYDFGFSTIVKLHNEDIPGSNDKVVMYLRKYMSKDYNSNGYNKKSYFRTANLEFKEKIVTKSVDTSTGQVLNELLYSDKVLKKDNEKMSVYIINDTSLDFTAGNIYTDNNITDDDIKSIKSYFNNEVIAKPLIYGSAEYVEASNMFVDDDLIELYS